MTTDNGERVSGASFSAAFSRGLVFVVFIYLLAFGCVFWKSEETLLSLETGLASQTVDLERSFSFPPVEAAPEVGDAPVYARGEEPPAHVTEHGDPTEEPVDENVLRPAPIEGMTESSQHGMLPKVSDKGITPFMAYKRPFSIPSTPVIAIAVMNYGMSGQVSAEALIALPPEVSLILSPYAQDPEKWQKEARGRGHEVWLQVPMQTKDYPADDPGPKALLTKAGLQYNQNVMDWVLTRTTGYAGIAGATDDTFSEGAHMFESLLKGAFGRGLGYLEINPAADPQVETLAVTTHTPYARNAYFLDEVSLKMLESEARNKGYVVGILRPSSQNIKALTTWLSTLKAKNITLVPVSMIAGSESVEQPQPIHEQPH